MAVNSTQIGFEAAAEYSTTPPTAAPIAVMFSDWIDAKVALGSDADDVYAALRCAAEQADSYVSPAAVQRLAGEFLSLIEA